MDWNAIGAMGEILGAAAVVATLGYLAIQVRQATKVARSATRQAVAQMTISSSSAIQGDDSLAHALISPRASLSKEDLLRLEHTWFITFRNWEHIHYQFQVGLLDEDEWRGFRLQLKQLMGTRRVKEYWDRDCELFSSAFQREVAAILQETGS